MIQMMIKDKAAKLISGLFSPFLVIPVFGLLAIAALSAHDNFILWSLLFLILTVLSPFIFIYTSVRKGEITDIHVAIKEQRAKPFIISTLGAVILAVIYWKFAPHLFDLALTLMISGLVFAIISHFWKVSIHAAAFTGGVMILSFTRGNPEYLWLLLILPIIVWARIIRDRHTLAQSVMAAVLIALCVLIFLPKSF